MRGSTFRSPVLGGGILPERSGKPRSSGITITVDFGIGPAAQRDWLSVSAETVDFAGLIPPPVLQEKLATYHEYDVTPFPGGMFLEYAYARGAVTQYLEWARACGFQVVEVSDNAVTLGSSVKVGLAKQARDLGLIVLGEVGSKHESSSLDVLIDDAQQLLEAGCTKVLIEAAEIIDQGEVRTELIDAIDARLPLEHIVFELPGPWLAEVHHHQVQAIEAWLVDRFGSSVNIANDPVGNSLFLETYRRQVGPNMLVNDRS